MSDNGTRAALITAIRETCPKNWLTVSEAAAKVGRSTDTLTKWRQRGLFEPTQSIQFGKLTVYLYTPDDIASLRKFAKTMRPGPKPGAKQKRSKAAVTAQRQRAVRTTKAKKQRLKSEQSRRRGQTGDVTKVRNKLRALANGKSAPAKKRAKKAVKKTTKRAPVKKTSRARKKTRK